MITIKTFDIVLGVIEEAREAMSISQKDDIDVLNWLKVQCGTIDTLLNDFDGEEFSAEVEDDTYDIILSMMCSGYSQMGEEDDRLELLMTTSAETTISFVDGKVLFEFVVPGVWKVE